MDLFLKVVCESDHTRIHISTFQRRVACLQSHLEFKVTRWPTSSHIVYWRSIWPQLPVTISTFIKHLCAWWGFPGGSVVKNVTASTEDTGDVGSIPGLGRSPGGRYGNPLQYSCLGNPMNRGPWQATVHGVTKSLTQLCANTHTHTHTYMCLVLHCFTCTVSTNPLRTDVFLLFYKQDAKPKLHPVPRLESKWQRKDFTQIPPPSDTWYDVLSPTPTYRD